jgi:DMSO/TMAO reductase YedYZ molybdopterin-dependent catalytic subunit
VSTDTAGPLDQSVAGGSSSAPAVPASPALPAGRRWPFFVAGVVAVMVAIAVGEIVAGLIAGAPSLVVAIGTLVIDEQPPGAKDIVVSLFGTNDKLFLNVLILVVALVVGGLLGLLARTRLPTVVAGFIGFGVLALFSALRMETASSVLSVVTVVLAVGAALGTLWLLIGLAVGRQTVTGRPARTRRTEAAGRTPTVAGTFAMPDWDRRRFLMASGALAVGSVVIGSIGRSLLQGAHSQQPAVATLPTAGLTPAPLAPDTSLAVPGITPIVVPNDDFYRIDTALIVPRVDATTWTVKVTGMVDHEVSLTYDQLRALPIFEQYVTIACVSNEVGGNLVGNALWRGVHLREVLAMAGVKPEATQIVGRSVDGFTVGFPTEWAMDLSREPMIALGMNGQPLPVQHGFPARLIVPGLYGYVSATKWLAEIELTTLEAFDAYWVPLGWSKEAPILTQSRIDVPQDGAGLQAGPVAIAGVAWAPDRGVSKVEVRIDDGPWQPATTSSPISKATWLQWRLGWNATSGDHQIQVRATDGTGQVQTEETSPPAPDGARGYHTIKVGVG